MKIISTSCCNKANEPQVLTLMQLYSILDVLGWSEGLERNWNWDASSRCCSCSHIAPWMLHVQIKFKIHNQNATQMQQVAADFWPKITNPNIIQLTVSWGLITHTDSSSWHLKLKCWQLSSINVTWCHFCCSILKIMEHVV